MAIDSYDIAILTALEENAGLSSIDLSKKVHLSRTAVARRIARLEDEGVMGKPRVDVDYGKLGFSIHALIEISAPRRDTFRVRDELLERPEVLALWVVLGEHLNVAEVITVDTDHLHQFLSWLNDIGTSETNVILKYHPSRISLRDRLRKIEELRAEGDPRLADDEPQDPA